MHAPPRSPFSYVAIVLVMGLSCRMLAADNQGLWTRRSLPDQVKDVHLRSICFVDNHGWMVGDRGTCLRTQDGGKTWVISPIYQQGSRGRLLMSSEEENPKEQKPKSPPSVNDPPSTATLRCVRFADATHGWVCGDSEEDSPSPHGHVVSTRPPRCGMLLVTENGGESWNRAWISTNFQITSVEISAAPTLQVGINGGPRHLDGDITRSSDGGDTWSGHRCYRALFDIRSLNQERWVAVGSPVSVGFSPEPTDPLYTNGKARAIWSDDGGENWSPATGSDGTSGACLHGLAVIDDHTLLAVGDEGAIFRSVDGGKAWVQVGTGLACDLTAVTVAAKANLAIAVGKSGYVVISRDGGASWQAISMPVQSDLLGIAVAGDAVFVVGRGGVVLSASIPSLLSSPTIPARSYSNPRSKPATKEQISRIHVGDAMTYRMTQETPQGKSSNEVVYTVKSLASDDYEQSMEVISGPLESKTEKTAVQRCSFRDILLPTDLPPVGKSRITTVDEDITTLTRLADESLLVDGKRIPCAVIDSVTVSGDDAVKMTKKSWLSLDKSIIGDGLVRMILRFEMPGDDGPLVQVTNLDLLRCSSTGKH